MEKDKRAIEELENIKYNIEGRIGEDKIDYYTLAEIVKMMNNRISELKDTEFNHEAFYEFLLNTINPNEIEKYRSMFLSSGEIVKD